MELSIKDLIPGLSDEVANQIHTLFSSKITESFELGKTTAKAEHDSIVEAIKAEHTSKLAEKEAEHIKTVKELNESANQYGQTLLKSYENDVVAKMRESHTNTVAEYVKQIDQITESANQYRQEIEDKLTESASQYVASVIQKYKDDNKELFEKVEKQARVQSLVESIKGQLESFGFNLDEDAKYKDMENKIVSLTESVNTLTSEKEELNKRITEGEIKVKKEASITKLVENLSDNEKLKIKKLSESVNTSDIEEFERIVGVFVKASLNEGVVTKPTNRITENVNNTKESNVTISDIASKMV